MKKSLIFGLGMVLMVLQANIWAATCATEKKAKGYMVKVLSPAMATVINKNDPFLVQYSDPGQSLGIVVTVALHTITGNKKAPKAVKALKNQPNSGSVLLTGANLMNPGSKADGKFFFRVSGAGKSVDSYCFTFAPQLKGAAKQTADAELQGLQQTVKTYAEQIAALTKTLADLEIQLATGADKKALIQRASDEAGATKSCYISCKEFQDTIYDLQSQISHLSEALSNIDRRLNGHTRAIGKNMTDLQEYKEITDSLLAARGAYQRHTHALNQHDHFIHASEDHDEFHVGPQLPTAAQIRQPTSIINTNTSGIWCWWDKRIAQCTPRH
ncbi:MAG: hypothetical protein HOC85_10180 [Acidiferrobacteraceae bacterium]|nr:hypothetical protein [Acidiferrobacteraceae bacterium]